MLKNIFFKNLHLKIFSLLAATVFWFFVVSLENTFFEFPSEVGIQVFNLSSELALSSELQPVKLTLRAQDPLAFKEISQSDFEAYVDLRNIGAGERRIPISVTSRNPQISVVRSDPSELNVVLEPVRQKTIPLSAEVKGRPASGYRVGEVTLSASQISVKGADTILRRIMTAKAEIELSGNEREHTVKNTQIKIYDGAGAILTGFDIESNDITANVEINEVATNKQVGVKPIISGSPDGTIKKITSSPALVEISGMRDSLQEIEFIETEAVNVAGQTGVYKRKARLSLPDGISLTGEQSNEVEITVEIEKQTVN